MRNHVHGCWPCRTSLASSTRLRITAAATTLAGLPRARWLSADAFGRESQRFFASATRCSMRHGLARPQLLSRGGLGLGRTSQRTSYCNSPMTLNGVRRVSRGHSPLTLAALDLSPQERGGVVDPLLRAMFWHTRRKAVSAALRFYGSRDRSSHSSRKAICLQRAST